MREEKRERERERDTYGLTFNEFSSVALPRLE